MYAVGLYYDHGHGASRRLKSWKLKVESLSWLLSRFGAKSSRERKPKWLSGLQQCSVALESYWQAVWHEPATLSHQSHILWPTRSGCMELLHGSRYTGSLFCRHHAARYSGHEPAHTTGGRAEGCPWHSCARLWCCYQLQQLCHLTITSHQKP